MAKKERIEDLGRIRELSDELLSHELFTVLPARPKDMWDAFLEMTEEESHEFILTVSYAIQSAEQQISEIYNIALGDDSEETEE